MVATSPVSVNVKAPKKVSLGAASGKPERITLIDRLCNTLGTEYRGLKQYRSL